MNKAFTPRNTRNYLPSEILLVGHPNVGKSVLFSHLTGVRTIASNYPGTTVSYASGRMRFGNSTYQVVDAPGSYSLEPLDDASRVAVDLIDDAQRIIHVVDATHLERNLPLTLELIAQKKPIVVALNMSDEARYKGIKINAEKLARKIKVPVIPTVARTGEGVKKLIDTLLTVERPSTRQTLLDRNKIWQRVGDIVDDVQTLTHHHRSSGELLEELSVHPIWGTVFAICVIALSFSLIRLIGEFLIGGGIGIIGKPWVEIPFGIELFFEKALKPLLMKLSALLRPDSFPHKLLIGTLIDGEIDFMQSFGMLTSALFIPLGAVLPYLITFYFVLSLLEDIGYLPRLAVFLDNIMHHIGLHGYAIIPTLLGLGCNVPGIMATRILETKRQRFITATLLSIAVPCAALQAMIIGLVGSRGAWPVIIVYGTLFIVWLMIGTVLRLVARGFRPELLIEIPPYRIPSLRSLVSKMWMRISGFFKEALPIIIGAVFVINVLYQFKLFEYISRFAEPVVNRLWGMPKESIIPLLVGILRKDVAIGMFAPLEMNTKQLITGSVVLSMFFPCIATVVVLFRELGIKNGLKSLCVMIVSVFLVGSILNLVL